METDIIKHYIIQEDNIVKFDNETYLVKPLFSSKGVESYLSIAKKGAANCYIYLRLCSDAVPANKELILKCSTPDLELCSKMERVPVFNQKVGKYVSRFRIMATVENVFDIIHSQIISLSWGQDTIQVETSIDDYLLTGFFIQARGLSSIPESQKEVINAVEQKAKQLQEEEEKRKKEEQRRREEEMRKKQEEQRQKEIERHRKEEEAAAKRKEERKRKEEEEKQRLRDRDIQLRPDAKIIAKLTFDSYRSYYRHYWERLSSFSFPSCGNIYPQFEEFDYREEITQLFFRRKILFESITYYHKYNEPLFDNCTIEQLYDIIDEITTTDEVINNLKKRNNNPGACYIATAVYGSYDCPEVWTLRRFRDYSLDATWYGRLFIRSYYAISPILVQWFGQCAWFKKVWRKPLDRLVDNLHNRGFDDSPYKDNY